MVDRYRGQEKKRKEEKKNTKRGKEYQKQGEKHSEKNHQININKIILNVGILLSEGPEPV
jgi:hypothetical protein